MEKGKSQDSSVHAGSLGVEYYLNDWGYDTSDAIAYGWAREICESTGTLTWACRTWGGTSAGWYGTSTFDKMVLNQSTTISKFGVVSISWPPSWGGSSTSKSWSSLPISSNPAGATKPEIRAVGTKGIGSVTKVVHTDNADIYLIGNSHVYRPQTRLTFYSIFSAW
jgi:hypothetical protein